MTTSINEARIGGLQQNFQLVVGIFLVQVRKKIFFAAGWDSHLSTEFPQKTWGKGQSISGRGKKGQFISGSGKKQD